MDDQIPQKSIEAAARAMRETLCEWFPQWDRDQSDALALVFTQTALTAALPHLTKQRDAQIDEGPQAYGEIQCGEKMVISAMRDAGPFFAAAIENGELPCP